MKFIDITGQKFWRLTAVEYTHRALSSGRRMPAWKMRCDCGNEVVVMTINLNKGNHKSCGCMKAEATRETRDELGVTRMPEYRVYRQMLDRCYLESASNYAWYGAKGVSVCDRWRFGEDGRTGFLCFYGDMGPRPAGLTLDREDPFKPYEPDNCRWASWKTQRNNQREHHADDAARVEISKARAVSFRRKCTDEAIFDIRARLERGDTQIEIEAETGISQQMVSRIKNRIFIPVCEMGS